MIAEVSRKKWTILIYFAGDNNLSEECVFALKEMQAVGTNDYDVLVQFDPAGRGNPTRRFHFRGLTAHKSLEELEIKQLDETDTGARSTLVNFLTQGMNAFRADYYMVVLSGHGGGADEDYFLRDEDRPQSLVPRSLSMPDFNRVFRERALAGALKGRRINILGLDACVMSMIEICYELRNSKVDLLAGSEGYTLNAGWPYGSLLSLINKDPHIDPESLARQLPQLYTDAYEEYDIGGISADLSVLKVSEVRVLKAKIKKLASAMRKQLSSSIKNDQFGLSTEFRRAIVLAHWLAQSYNGEQCVDLYDFCECLLKCCELEQYSHTSIIKACNDVMEAIGRIVLGSKNTGSDFQYSNGVSIYFPWSEVEIAPHYKYLDFVAGEAGAKKENRKGWYTFLLRYVKATQRAPRPGVRLTPPYHRGPGKVLVHSMRNPPRAKSKEY